MDEAVARARALVGCAFRPQGRDPEIGVDCVGLACAAFAIPVDQIPRDYKLRGDSRERLDKCVRAHFRRVPSGRAGDLLVLSVAEDQVHLAVKADRGFIHADARLRKVVETPGAPPWPILSAYRFRQPIPAGD